MIQEEILYWQSQEDWQRSWVSDSGKGVPSDSRELRSIRPHPVRLHISESLFTCKD